MFLPGAYLVALQSRLSFELLRRSVCGPDLSLIQGYAWMHECLCGSRAPIMNATIEASLRYAGHLIGSSQLLCHRIIIEFVRGRVISFLKWTAAVSPHFLFAAESSHRSETLNPAPEAGALDLPDFKFSGTRSHCVADI